MLLVTCSYSLHAPFCICMSTDIQAFWKVSTLEPVFLSLLVGHWHSNTWKMNETFAFSPKNTAPECQGRVYLTVSVSHMTSLHTHIFTYTHWCDFISNEMFGMQLKYSAAFHLLLHVSHLQAKFSVTLRDILPRCGIGKLETYMSHSWSQIRHHLASRMNKTSPTTMHKSLYCVT